MGAEDRIERLVGRKALLMNNGLVVRRRVVARNRDLDCLVQLRRVESFLLRRVLLPVETIGVVRSTLSLDARRERERGDTGERDVSGHEEGFYRDSGFGVRDSTPIPTPTNPEARTPSPG